MKTTLTVIGPPSSEENSFFVPERGPVLRSWLSQEEEDRKQDSGSDSEMTALGYSENTTCRHAELVSKYCSQGLSNLQPPATTVIQSPRYRINYWVTMPGFRMISHLVMPEKLIRRGTKRSDNYGSKNQVPSDCQVFFERYLFSRKAERNTVAGIDRIIPMLPEIALIISVAITSILIILIKGVLYARKTSMRKIELPV